MEIFLKLFYIHSRLFPRFDPKRITENERDDDDNDKKVKNISEIISLNSNTMGGRISTGSH
jgi:hypothetical protein